MLETKVTLIEQEKKAGLHTSSRNTGKVHAPFIYNPEKKKILAMASLLGYDFWKQYCKHHNILFKEDGIIEVATDDHSIDMLSTHYEWGIKNGLEKDEIKILEKDEIKKIEPNLKCQSAIICNKDASVEYGKITQSIAQELSNGNHQVDILTSSKVSTIKYKTGSNSEITIVYKNTESNEKKETRCDFLINATGGNALNVLNMFKIDHQYIDLYFRGEYWVAPVKYHTLTNHSIYSVPEFSKFPFLDPHWIIRSDGNREVGPNACPVFSPYGYGYLENIKESIPKIFTLLKGYNIKNGRTLLNKEIIKLIYKESLSSISKTFMIKRVKKFLPDLQPKDFITRGTSGIRSNIIDKYGNFMLNPIFLLKDNTLHILNYNSPGATGAFPISYALVFNLLENGILKDFLKIKEKEILTPFNKKMIKDCRQKLKIDFIR